jgi:chromosome segregation ATPase
MSRPPLAPKITDALYDMYEDAKKVNELTTPSELLKKLSIIEAVNQRITQQLQIATQSSRPDPFIKRKLETALQENVTIRQSVQNSLAYLQSGDSIALLQQLDQKARIIAALQAELDSRNKERDKEIERLSIEKTALEQTLDQLNNSITQKETELNRLRELSKKLSESKKLEQRVQELERELDQLKGECNLKLISHQAEIQAKQQEISFLSAKLEENISESAALRERIQQLSTARNKLADTPRAEGQIEFPQPVDTSALKKCEADLLRISSEKTQIEQQRVQLEKELAELTARLTNSTQEYQSLQDSRSKEQRELESVKQQLDNAKSEKIRLLAELESVKQELRGQVEGIEREKQQHLSLLEQEKSSTPQLRQAIEAKEQEISSLKLINEQLKVDKERQLTDLKQQEDTTASLKVRISELETQIQIEQANFRTQLELASSGQTEQTQRLISENLEKIRTLQEQLNIKTDEQARLQNDLSEKGREYTEKLERITSLENETNQLNQQLQITTADLEEKTRSLSTIEAQLQEAKRLESEHQREITRLQEENIRINEMIETQRNQETERQAQIASLNQRIESLQLELERKEKNSSTLQTSIDTSVSELGQLREETRRLKEEIARQKIEMDTKIAELKTKESDLVQKQTDIDELYKKLESVQQQVYANEQEKEQLSQQLQQAELKQQEELKMLNLKLSSEEQKLKLEIQRINKSLEEEKAEKVNLTKELEQSRTQQLEDLQSTNSAALEKQKQIYESTLDDKEREKTGLQQSLADCNDRLMELKQSYNTELTAVRAELQDLQRVKDEEKNNYEEIINTLRSQLSEKENKISSLETDKKAESDELNRSIADVKEKLRLSEEIKADLEQRIKQYQDLGSAEDIRQKIKEQEEQIKQTEVHIRELRTQNDTLSAEITTSLSKHKDEMAELEQKYTKMLGDEKELHMQEKAQILLQSESVSSIKNQLDEQLKNLSESLESAHKRSEELQAERDSMKAEVEDVKKRFEEQIKQKIPPALGDLSRLLFEGLDKAEVIDLMKQEIELLKENMIKAVSIYQELVGEVYTINVDEQKFGTTGMKQYIIPVVHMFHAWKALLRIPIVLRGGAPKDIYLYDAPDEKVKDQLFLMINTDLIERSYSSKIQDGKMRIDVLLYYLLVALMNRITRDYTAEEYRALINYIKTLLQYSNNKLIEFTNALESLIITTADRVADVHNKTSPIISFIRLSSKTPGDNSIRFPYKIINDRILEMQYSSKNVPFYTRNELGDYTLNKAVTIEYDGNYYFGPFTYIYRETQKNEDIVKNEIFTENIENRLRDGKPVCIIGYGASGSGKTTTLVYADYMSTEDGRPIRVTQPGILILLANKLAKGNKSFDKCYVTIYEIEANQDDNGKSGVCRKFPGNKAMIERSVRGSDGKVVTNQVPFDECEGKHERVLEYINENGSWKSVTGEEIQTQLVDYINVKRNIAPSPNNPQSSRSHVIAKLQFKHEKENRETNLIVCDFAGVENRFNCNDQESLDIMGYPFLVQQENELYVSKAKDYMDEYFDKLNFSEDFKKIFIPDDSYSFSYADKSPLLLTKGNDGQLSPENLDQALKTCYTLYDLLLKDELPENIKYIAGLDKGYSVDKHWNLSRISKSYDGIDSSSDSSRQFKQSPFSDIYEKVTSTSGYNFIETQYTKVAKSTMGNFPLLVKMVWWFLTSYKNKKDANRFPLIDAIIQSHMSFKIREQLEDQENKAALQLVLPEAKIEKFMKQSICFRRVNEGIYINESLAQLRRFISDTIQSKRDKNDFAPFVDQCAPLQCNPYYRDCFGQTSYYDQSQKELSLKVPSAYGLLSKYIMDVENSGNMTFCIINVMNLSKDANNPPKSPYINITPLQIEYEKMLPYLNEEKEDLLGMSNGTLLQTTKEVVKYTMELINTTKGTEGIRQQVSIHGNQVLKQDNPIGNLRRMIDVINSFNAITPIGTLEFTDMMAKYAINRVTCNTSRPVIVLSEEQKSGKGKRLQAEVDTANIISAAPIPTATQALSSPTAAQAAVSSSQAPLTRASKRR